MQLIFSALGIVAIILAIAAFGLSEFNDGERGKPY